jgi:hypothetical protein
VLKYACPSAASFVALQQWHEHTLLGGGLGFNRWPAIGAEVLKLISAKRSLQIAAVSRKRITAPVLVFFRAKPSPVTVCADRKELALFWKVLSLHGTFRAARRRAG